MGKNTEPQTVTIDEKQYIIDDMTHEQKIMLEHCVDLDRKLASCQFQFDQLRIGKDAFLAMLKKSLESEVTEVADEVVQ